MDEQNVVDLRQNLAELKVMDSKELRRAYKQRLRDVLQRDPKLRPLLNGMRQALDYERRPPWQPPPDVERLSSAIENVSKVFWKSVASGRLRHRLRAATKPAPGRF